MSAPTFKTMIKAGEIKRADAMKVKLQDLHVEPGFNLRIEGEDLEASIALLATYIKDGGQYPALEVRPRAEGGVWIVDGHRRQRALLRAVEDGAPLADANGDVWVSVVAFTGNDADRVARVITSAEHRSLSPLETATGYARLAAFGWDAQRIADKVGKTRQHVDQLLILAGANTDVQRLVSDGAVSASVAVQQIRQHGEGAGESITQALAKAKAAGKSKVTAGGIKGKALPPAVVSGLVGSVDAFMGSLDKSTRECLARIEFKAKNAADGGAWEFPERIEVSAPALLALLKSHAEVADARAKQEAKQREKLAKANQAEIPAAGEAGNAEQYDQAA